MKPNVSPLLDLTKNKIGAKTLLNHLQEDLGPRSDSSYLDSLLLLSHISGLTKSQLLADPDLDFTDDQAAHLTQALAQLQSGMPLPYILGEWEFFQRLFTINPQVLIPRPETEGLVEMALSWLKDNPQRRTSLEIGTGCGCIAISLALEIPDLQIRATDISEDALQVARENARRHQIGDRITFLKRDLLQEIEGKVDLIVANLPYVPTGKLTSLPVFKTEPVLALDGGRDGLVYITRVLKNARELMNPGGAILLELDEDTGGAALALAHEVWPGRTLKLTQDLAGNDRYLSVEC